MCTVSWIRRPAGLELFCNRDERRARPAEIPPEVFDGDGVRFAAPRDGLAGGTWCLANERGLVLCLLNGELEPAREPAEPAAGAESRGRLVWSLVGAADPDDVRARLAGRDPSAYRPFVLVALAPERDALIATWDGARLAFDADGDRRVPLVSSSFDSAGVGRARRETYAELVGRRGAVDLALLESFHASHARGPSAYSPCMHRADAETRSHTRVSVDARAVELRWQPGALCAGGRTEVVRLARSGRARASR